MARSARSATSGARSTCWTSCGQSSAMTKPGLLVSRSFGPTEGARRDLERAATWFADPAASGGLLFELASHDIDLQIALAGPVESVQRDREQRSARARRRAGRARLDDAVSVLLRFTGGASAPCHVAWTTGAGPAALRPRRAERRRRAPAGPRSRSSSCADAPTAPRSPRSGTVHPRVSSVTRFLDAVRSGDPAGVPCSPAAALATLRTLLACERAIASGERVAV